ncbi:MAG: methylenetetrahydrofolate reductase [NAD(P)H] [Candidatus Margulisiibacteriota bacterium]
MKVIEALKKGKPTLSFEFFPPKTKEQEARLFEVIAQLKKFNPDFVSVTCGALGTTRQKTFFWVKEIKQRFQIEPVAHLTCVAATQMSILEQIEELSKLGVKNILALRGDPPEDQKDFVPPKDGFRFAQELVAFIKKNNPQFCLGVAGYPEKHPEAPDLETDIKHLKEKVEAGAEYIITQLFFNNKDFFNFKEKCEQAGIRVPIVSGIMPVTSLKQVKKMTRICGATIPPELLERLEKFGGDRSAVRELGIEQALSQCQELLERKVPGLHFFVLNQAGPIGKMLTKLKKSAII